MMIPLESYLRRPLGFLRRHLPNPEVRTYLRIAGYLLAGFCLSAASLLQGCLPIALGLILGCSGWSSALCALGSCAGYLVFWGSAGFQGVLWSFTGLAASLLIKDRQNEVPLLIPALSGFLVSATGVIFQLWLGDQTPVSLYLLRVAMAIASGWLLPRVLRSRNPVEDWLACCLCVLALAQIAPVVWLNLGCVAGAALCVMGAFPAAALAGLALDLAGIVPVSMTAVLCCGYLIRFLPRYSGWAAAVFPLLSGLFIMSVSGKFSAELLPALLVGGLVGAVIPTPSKVPYRRGETGVAQVRLELAASALSQYQQLLLEVREHPVDADSLVQRAAQQACSSCPCRHNCQDISKIANLPGLLLHKPLLSAGELPVSCRKSSRFLAQLHHSQEQLRSIRADRLRQREYRESVVQQFHFLSEYLQSLSDQLGRKSEPSTPIFTTRVQIYANRPESDNGDRVARFSGVGCRYYVILCDGMGKGSGAMQEAATAQSLLRRLLTAGYPAEHSLKSLNSLCALRNRAGAVTVDLAEVQTDTGRIRLYKWGAMPSFLLSGVGAEKIGTAGPPPGLSPEESRETVYQLSLRRGETLVLVSDGVGEEDALHCCLNIKGSTPGELAQSLLTCSQYGGEDDATVVLIRLDPGFAGS